MRTLFLYTTWDYWKSWNHGEAIPAWTQNHASPYEILIEFPYDAIGEKTDEGMFIIRKKQPQTFSRVFLFTKWSAWDAWLRGKKTTIHGWTKDHYRSSDEILSFYFYEEVEHTHQGLFRITNEKVHIPFLSKGVMDHVYRPMGTNHPTHPTRPRALRKTNIIPSGRNASSSLSGQSGSRTISPP